MNMMIYYDTDRQVDNEYVIQIQRDTLWSTCLKVPKYKHYVHACG